MSVEQLAHRLADELIAEKLNGGDCTDDESAWIKWYFDRNHPIQSSRGAFLASVYTLENDEWWDETERGLR